MAGIGLDAAVVRFHAPVPEGTPRVGRLCGRQPWRISGAGRTSSACRLDGGSRLTRRAHSVVVGNVGILPGGFSILPGASLEDGSLDVGVLAPQHILGWAVMARRMLAHGHDVDRQFEHHKASTVEVTTETELPRELDGDMIPAGRSLSVKVLPRALLVRAPL